MKVPTVDQTIKQATGHYWWRDWEDKADGGHAPARPNASFSCYISDGEVFSLTQTRQSGMAGGSCDWTVDLVQQGKLRDLVLFLGLRR